MRQQRALFISRRSVLDLLAASRAPATKLLGRAYALERQASLCDALFPWPALAESLRWDAQRIRARLDVGTQEVHAHDD